MQRSCNDSLATSPQVVIYKGRRGGRVAECGGLLNRLGLFRFNRFNRLQLGSNHLCRANVLSFGCDCSPLCSPSRQRQNKKSFFFHARESAVIVLRFVLRPPPRSRRSLSGSRFVSLRLLCPSTPSPSLPAPAICGRPATGLGMTMLATTGCPVPGW